MDNWRQHVEPVYITNADVPKSNHIDYQALKWLSATGEWYGSSFENMSDVKQNEFINRLEKGRLEYMDGRMSTPFGSFMGDIQEIPGLCISAVVRQSL